MIRRPVRFHGIALPRPIPRAVPSPFDIEGRLKVLEQKHDKATDSMATIQESIELLREELASKERIRGEDGKTPTAAQLLGMIRPLIPESIPGEKGEKPIAGIDFPLPEKGLDGVAPTAEEVGTALVKSKKTLGIIVRKIQSLIPQGKIEKQDIVDIVLEEVKKTLPDLPKLEVRFAEIRNQIAQKSAPYNPPPGSKRGGGDTVVAGSGITITNTRNGNKQISASGTGTSVTTQYQLNAIQSGSDVTIDLTQLTHYATLVGIITVYRNNVPQTETINFTYAAPILTVKNADAAEIFNLTYSYT